MKLLPTSFDQVEFDGLKKQATASHIHLKEGQMNLLTKVSKLSALAGIGLLAAMIATPAAAQDVTDQALGSWDRTNQGWVVEFAMCGEFLCGEIVSGEGEDKNSGEPVVGIQMLFDLERYDDTQWRGRMYNPEDGHEYAGRVTILSENEIRMSGCMLGGIICRSEDWPRAE